AVHEECFVNLSQRRAGERRFVEAGEQVADRMPELLLDAFGDLLVRPWRDAVLETLETGPELRGQGGRHDAPELAYLDEQAFELDERTLDAARIAEVDVANAAVCPVLAEDAPQEKKPEVAEQDDEGRPVRADEAVALLRLPTPRSHREGTRCGGFVLESEGGGVCVLAWTGAGEGGGV